MVFEICAIIATIALILLTIYIIVSLKKINRVVDRIEKDLPPSNEKLQSILEHCSRLTLMLNEQLAAFIPLANSIENIGIAMEESTHSLSQRTKLSHPRRKSDWKQKVGDALELAEIGAHVWQQIQKRRD